jgi:hypothetical protein
VTEYVSNTIAQLLADFANSCIGCPAVRTVITAELDQGDLGERGSQCVVSFRIDGTFQAIVHGCN